MSTRFRKGQSGNPKGRPRGRKAGVPFEAVLGQVVTLRDDGVERRVTAAEAFLMQMAKKGLEGDSAAARQTLALLQHARDKHLVSDGPNTFRIIRRFIDPGSVTTGLEPLGIAQKLDRYRPTARMVLNPWIVEKALSQLQTPLTRSEQEIVLRATRTPKKVKWPAWWVVMPEW